MPDPQSVSIRQATASTPGAIAIIELFGPCKPMLASLTGVKSWPIGTLRRVVFDEIDEGVAGLVAENHAQLMPHGGPRVVQRLIERLSGTLSHGSTERFSHYPEAADRIEDLVMQAVARAASPMAVDLLLAQPDIWREKHVPTTDDLERSQRLNRLIDPPTVVLAGAANVGKSTLGNALASRRVSISFDAPGTTRDYTATGVDLGGCVVRWHDTPGIRQTSDPLERRAIELAQRLIATTDLLIAMTDFEHDWPDLPRTPDLRVASKMDVATRDDADVCISTLTSDGLGQLVQRVRDALVPPQDVALAARRPWLFDTRLSEEIDDDA